MPKWALAANLLIMVAVRMSCGALPHSGLAQICFRLANEAVVLRSGCLRTDADGLDSVYQWAHLIDAAVCGVVT